MNARERFLACMDFDLSCRVPLWELGYWAGAVRRWYGEGLPKRTGLPDWLLDGQGVRGEGAYWDESRPPGPGSQPLPWLRQGHPPSAAQHVHLPAVLAEVLEDHGEWILWRDEDGIVKKDLKNRQTLPHYVRGPVETREDWERLKAERLRPTIEGRLPGNWPELVREFRERDYPLLIGALHGFYGTPRYLLGDERVLTAFYDDPDLMRDITTHLTDLWIALYAKVFEYVKPDLALIWEDMCYRTGPLISPATFREFILPCYRRLTAFLKDSGVKVIHVDTDGNVWKLLPLFVEGGITGMYPFEAMAGMNVVEVREAFPKLQILGGIGKTKVAAGKREIDEELAAKVPYMLARGGYIPFADHLVPPDVAWADFEYYRRRVADMVAQGAGPVARE